MPVPIIGDILGAAAASLAGPYNFRSSASDNSGDSSSTSNTVKVVQAERKRLHREAGRLDAIAQDLGLDIPVLDTFERAPLQDASHAFSLGDLKAKFVGKYGIVEADLNLSKEAIDALSPTNDEQRKKKEALKLKLELETFAKEVADKQQKALWQHHILFGTLLADDEGRGAARDSGMSLDDLDHLHGQTKDLKILDNTRLPKNVTVKWDNGKPYFRVNASTTMEDIAQTVHLLAASGSRSVTINCDKYSELPQYTRMAETTFETMLQHGYDMEVNVTAPTYLSNYSSFNKDGEPSWTGFNPFSTNKDEFRKGKAEHEYWQDVFRCMPRGAAVVADKDARLAQAYSKLQMKHKVRFLKERLNDPKRIAGMVAYYVRTGQTRELVQLECDVKQHLGRELPVQCVQEAVAKQLQTMTSAEMNTALDKTFDDTRASRHFRDFSFNSQMRGGVVEQLVSGMSVAQMRDYGRHMGANSPARFADQSAQLSERAGRIIMHAGDVGRREAFIKSVLEEAHSQACERHGIKPGVIGKVRNPAFPAPPGAPAVPEMIDETAAQREERYQKVQADVQAVGEQLLVGTRDYAQRMGLPNRSALDATQDMVTAAVGDLAGKRSDDVSTLYNGGVAPAADRTAYIDQAQRAYQAAPAAAAFIDRRDQFARQQPAAHVRMPG